jgi:hypothetical protein
VGTWLPIAVFLIGIALLIGRFTFGRKLGMGGRMLFGLGFMAVVLAALAYPYVLFEFIKNQGPDDFGAMHHTGELLTAKYGKPPSSQYQDVLQRFDLDGDASGSGTYRFRFICGDHSGVILAHYNKLTREFDKDEIEPDKPETSTRLN